MAEGEELPPVVATLVGDDESFLAMLERDIAAARQFAADLQAAIEEGIGGITVSGAQISGQGIGAAGEVLGEQLATGIEEGMGALDLGPELQGAAGAATEAGQAAGSEMAAGIEESFGEATSAIVTGLAEAGAAGGEALNEALGAQTATAGDMLAARISEQLRLGLDEAAQATMDVLHRINAAGLGGALASGLSGMGLASGLSGSLTAALVDAATEAGASGGGALMGALGDSAAQDGAAAAGRAAAAVQAPLGAAMEAAGEASGVRYAEGLQRGMASVNIPMGGLALDQLLGQQKAPDEFVESPVAPGQMVRESRAAELAAQAQQAAQEAARAFDDAVASVTISPRALSSMSDDMLGQWREEVETQAAMTGRGFTDAFAEAMRAEMSGIDWAALTDAQAAALQQALSGAMGRSGEETGTVFGAAWQRAMSALTEQEGAVFSARAAETGAQAGEHFGEALNEAQPGLAARFTAYWSDAFSQVWDIVGGPQIADALSSLSSSVADRTSAMTHAFVDYWAQAFGQVDEIVAGPQIREALGELTGDAEAQVESMRERISTGISGFWADVQANADSLRAAFSTAGQQAGEAFDTGLQQSFSQMSVEGGWQERLAAQNALVETQMAAGAEAAAAQTERVGTAARNAQGPLGGLAGIMNGPLMQGIFGLSAIAYLPMALGQMIPMVAGFADKLSGMAQAQEVAALAAQTLGTAVSQDSGFIGQNTAAAIENILVKSNMTDLAQKLGVSQATLIEYAAGETEAQKGLTSAFQAKIDAIGKDIDAGKTGLDAGNMQIQQLYSQKSALDELTTSVISSINADRDQTQALTEAENTAQIFNATLDDTSAKFQAQAQSSAIGTVGTLGFSDGQGDLNRVLVDSIDAFNTASGQASAYATVIGALDPRLVSTAQYQFLFQQALDATAPKLAMQASNTALSAVAALQLGDNQTAVNLELYNAVNAYSQATSQASAYSSILTAMDGSMQNMLSAEAAFTIGLDGVSKAAQANGHSLDINNINGAKNIQTFTQLAQTADKAAVSIYQSDVNTGHASQAYQDATTKLQQEKDAFEQAAEKAGFNKDAVQELADELFKLPPSVPIDVDVTNAVQHTEGLVQWIDTQTGTITVQASDGSGVSYNPASGGGKASYDGGGWTRAAPGQPEPAIVHGGEYMLSEDMLAGRQQVDPAVLALLGAGGGRGYATPVGLPSLGSSGTPAPNGPVTIVANIYLDGALVGQQVMTGSQNEAQAFARRNSITGFAAVGR